MSLLALMYHSISRDRTDDLFTVEESRFKDQLAWLKKTGHQAVTISQVVDWLDGRNFLPRRAFLITFDDGYLDNLEAALPLLRRYQATACIFVTTDWCGEKERRCTRRGKRQCPMLTWGELRQLADAGIEIGSHSISHPFLTKLNPDAAWEEIQGAKLEIENHLGLEVRAFSYPNSNHNQVIRDMVRRAGYRLAFGGDLGLSRDNTDRYNLYRSCVYNYCRIPEFMLSICTGINARARYQSWRNTCIPALRLIA